MGNQQESSLWKVIDEFPRYEINADGQIRDVETKRIKYTNKFHKGGYELVQFKKNKITYCRKVHRLVAEAFLPPPEEWLVELCRGKGSGLVLVNHKDGDKLNSKVDNLEWCDDAFNNLHAVQTGLTIALKGELNGRSTISEELVHTVCKSFENGMMPKEASEKYNISRAQATKIRSGHAWVHISSQYNISVRKRKSSTTSRKA